MAAFNFPMCYLRGKKKKKGVNVPTQAAGRLGAAGRGVGEKLEIRKRAWEANTTYSIS
jgi:hypothetical protein